jgi:tetratricopeptide (TPR) repeat protein
MEAQDNFDKAISINSSDGNCYLNRAFVQNLLGRTTDAIQDYGKALSYLKEPEQQFKANFQRGIAYRAIGQIDNSIDDLAKACLHKRDNVDAQINLGISYF